MNLVRFFLLVILNVSAVWHASAQNSDVTEAQEAIKSGLYNKAIFILNNSTESNNSPNGLYIKGLAHYHLNYLNEAEKIFSEALSLGFDNPSCIWYLAQCKHHLLDYENAARLYREYLNKSADSGRYRIQAELEIRNCLFAAGKSSKDNKVKKLVQSFGSVNSNYDDIMPVQSRLFGNRFYFSSNRSNQEYKIYAFGLEQAGKWDSLDTSSEKYNYGKDSYIQDIDGSGSSMLILEENPVTGRHQFVFTSIYRDDEIRIPVKEALFSDAEDLMIVDDETLVFASNELDGYGGYDLYTIKYNNGAWSQAENLGPEINSVFDERSPCLSADQSVLYFSSNRPYAYGGFDLYTASLNSGNKQAVNLGPVVNSTADETHPRAYDDGHMLLFSSNRKSGRGGFDMYFLYQDLEEAIYTADSASFSFVVDNLNITRENEEGVVLSNEKPKKALNSGSEYTLVYDDSYDLIHGKNKIHLDALALAMKTHTDHLSILVFTDDFEPGLDEYVQYNCLKRGLTVREYLLNLGVAPSRIRVESMANNYPLVKYESGGQALDSLFKLNKRIEFVFEEESLDTSSFYNAENLSVPIFARSSKYELFRLIRDDLYFSVHIARTTGIFKNAILRLYNDVYIRSEAGSENNDYYIGLNTSIDDALALKGILSDMPGISPEIKAFYKSRLLSVDELEEMSNRFPQLKKLIP